MAMYQILYWVVRQRADSYNSIDINGFQTIIITNYNELN